MKDRSTLNLCDYCFGLVATILIAAFWYKQILFRCISGVSYSHCRLILFGMVLGYSIVCLVLFRSWRTYLTLGINVLIPFGIYTFLIYHDMLSTNVLILIPSFLSILYLIAAILKPIDSNSCKKIRIYKKRFLKCLYFANICFSTMFLGIMAFLGYNGTYSSNLIKADIEAARLEFMNMDDCTKDLMNFEDDIWCNLSIAEKMNALQMLANIEAYQLGLPHELNVGTNNLDDNVGGCYDIRTHSICVEYECLKDSKADYMVNLICHEAYHAYQFNLCEMVNKYDLNHDPDLKNLKVIKHASMYNHEFNHYISVSQDFDRYYSQLSEIDARNYAAQKTQEYYSQIRSQKHSK